MYFRWIFQIYFKTFSQPGSLSKQNKLTKNYVKSTLMPVVTVLYSRSMTDVSDEDILNGIRSDVSLRNALYWCEFPLTRTCKKVD